MAKVFRIQYDNTKEDVFVVHMDPKPIKFVKADNGLYIYRPSPRFINSTKQLKNRTPTLAGVQLLATVKENTAMFSDRQIQRAKAARDTYHAIGTPSV